MSEKSIFAKIIEGELPGHFIYKDDTVVAFLDAFPTVEGHTLVVPRTQVDHIWDLDDETYQHLMEVTKKLGSHYREIMKTARVDVLIEGFHVPHVHVQLLPTNEALSNVYASDNKYDPSQEDLAEIAQKLAL